MLLHATCFDSSWEDRQARDSSLPHINKDILLCRVYAQREAVSGNIDLIRKVFDMALLSAKALLPMQLRRARQGFRERLRTIHSARYRGFRSSSFNGASRVGSCSSSSGRQRRPARVAGEVACGRATPGEPDPLLLTVAQGQATLGGIARPLGATVASSRLQRWTYPYSSELFSALVDISHLYTLPNKLRWTFDELYHKRPSVVVWSFALAFEMGRGCSRHRIHGLVDRPLANDSLRTSV
ncbi:hypothetical protein NL676_022029 [Syzygium grande]|nr:hypothetical protein NL676_022029 [Syzygium grande]